jgi:hypothetical protein
MAERSFNEGLIRSDMLTYLRAGGFTYFAAADVADYTDLDQIWVRTTHTEPFGDCIVDLILDSSSTFMTFDDRRADERITYPLAAFSTEVATVAAKWSEVCNTYSSVLPVRNRPIPPNQPTHPVEGP